MGWKVYGETLLTADLTSNLRVFQTVKLTKNVVLRAVRAWFILFNDPALTSMTFDIYSADIENGNAPKKLLHSSTNSITKAQFLDSDTNGVREAFWQFNDVTLNKDDFYNFVPRGTGYTGTTGSHIAWKHSWPDSPYRTGLDLDYEELHVSPYNLVFIGGQL